MHRTLMIGLWLLGACGGGRAGGSAASDYAGTTLVPPRPQPDFTLPTTEGQSFHFKPETRSYVTLLFFGYTHCPDVCPVHMANLASVLNRLPPGVAGRIKVIFVTVDPGRDTPRVLRKWL